MLESLLRELEMRRNYLPDPVIHSIYLGGGTPSLLNRNELLRLFEKIYALFDVDEAAEITLEANPDDLTQEKLRELCKTPVNRLSIGIQSFSEEDLRFMNRAHNAIEARTCIEYAQDLGFDNLTIDLIYGSPTTSDRQWEHNLQITFDYEVPHVSAYALTVEERTALHHFVKKGKMAAPDEEQTARQFEMLMRAMLSEGYEHYEISNFALQGWHARHNSSYWTGEPYLGIGPSAHSYDGSSRQWNVANNARYIKFMAGAEHYDAVAKQGLPASAVDQELFEREILTSAQRYNEYVMTALRTKWGVQLKKIEQSFRTHFLEQIQPWVQEGVVTRRGEVYTLTSKGKLIADRVAMELFLEKE